MKIARCGWHPISLDLRTSRVSSEPRVSILMAFLLMMEEFVVVVLVVFPQFCVW